MACATPSGRMSWVVPSASATCKKIPNPSGVFTLWTMNVRSSPVKPRSRMVLGRVLLAPGSSAIAWMRFTAEAVMLVLLNGFSLLLDPRSGIGGGNHYVFDAVLRLTGRRQVLGLDPQHRCKDPQRCPYLQGQQDRQ